MQTEGEAGVRTADGVGRRGPGVFLAVAAVGLFAVFGGLSLVLIGGLNTGLEGLLFGMVLGVLPVPIYVSLALWLDRYEKEPLWMLAGAFAWGASVAIFFSFILNTASGLTVGLFAGAGAGNAFATVVSAPIVEETLKGLALLLLFLLKRNEFDGVVDGVVYAAMVGLGFAMVENFSYYGVALSEAGVAGGVATFFVRGILTPFNHPLYTAMLGIGLGLARESRHPAVKVAAPIGGFLAAIALHALWNGASYFAPGLVGLLVMILFLVVPPMLVVLLAVGLSLKREGRIVREELRPELDSGLFSEAEYATLGSVGGRLKSTAAAFFEGPSRWRARRRFNQTASRLAFHRHRLRRGRTSPTDAERESNYLRALAELRERV